MEPLVAEIMGLIEARADDPRLRWSADRRLVRVVFSRLVLDGVRCWLARVAARGLATRGGRPPLASAGGAPGFAAERVILCVMESRFAYRSGLLGLECAQMSGRIGIITDGSAEPKERVMAAVRMADLPATDTDGLVMGAGPTGLMARRHSSSSASRASSRSAGSHQSGQRTHRDGQPIGGGLPCKYGPNWADTRHQRRVASLGPAPAALTGAAGHLATPGTSAAPGRG